MPDRVGGFGGAGPVGRAQRRDGRGWGAFGRSGIHDRHRRRRAIESSRGTPPPSFRRRVGASTGSGAVLASWSRGAGREVHPLGCPSYHGQMRILAFLTNPGVVRPILRHLRIPEHPPPVSPTRGPLLHPVSKRLTSCRRSTTHDPSIRRRFGHQMVTLPMPATLRLVV